MESTLQVRVAEVIEETAEIRRFELVAEGGGELPAFEAGAHIDVYAGSTGIRQYSLCSAPWERHRYVIGVKREPQSRGGSVWMHDTVRPGASMTIGIPRNNFALETAADRHLLFGAGIGITPLLAMAETLARNDAEFTLYYFARSAAHQAFKTRLAGSPWASRVRYQLDDGGPTIDLAAELAAASPATHLYMCGPQGFMDAVRRAASSWPDENVHLEYFAAEPVEHVDGDQPFEIELARSGERFHIGRDETIAQVLLDAGVDIMTSCEQGVCGTCVTTYLDGEPEHRDFCLNRRERETRVALCCARAKTATLVLDL
ncbi:PDR/VanB family oxidoreductase [Paraburkholderia agricolaris]|uniref:PDR/VanB family oxidoreductase n=1 Tax=Paraburkholderia agricolaris TaxID=2152888 RepID=UPI00129121B5|nr:PDR/VanB family oxidoreductase [Paraburkholderia agricolaris]